ncbi:hypothetical protein RE628_15060 [Paenibacillus sp. D2_2]|uniref:hypothetical protein n=1 Tax=Paenibacillus sp. D2_2 TaxID=3073092 RepID=UPI002816842F|nr:hypothetical protein [Paenibacillus sp. D2_2]WMT38865.1 hypothetical protein RE628_15060 [Paenibacillus sp. D2_2]
MTTDHRVSQKQELAVTHKELFEEAESLFARGKWQPASELYEKIVKLNDERTVTDEIVICYFRIFYMTSETKPGNTEEMLRFIPFRYRLPYEHTLEGLYLLARAYAVLDRWDEVRQYAAEMMKQVELFFKKQNDNKFRNRPPFRRSIVAYYGQGLLMMSEAYESEMAYSEARECLEDGFHLPLIYDALPEDILEAECLSLLVKGRLLALELKTCELNRLPQLASLIEEYPHLRLEGLIGSLIAANKYGFSLDHNLEEMLHHFTETPAFMICGENQIRERDQYSRMYYQSAVYWLDRGELMRGASQLLRSIKISLYLKNQHRLLASLTMFEKHRQHIPDIISVEIIKQCQERTKEATLRFPWKQMLL